MIVKAVRRINAGISRARQGNIESSIPLRYIKVRFA